MKGGGFFTQMIEADDESAIGNEETDTTLVGQEFFQATGDTCSFRSKHDASLRKTRNQSWYFAFTEPNRPFSPVHGSRESAPATSSHTLSEPAKRHIAAFPRQ